MVSQHKRIINRMNTKKTACSIFAPSSILLSISSSLALFPSFALSFTEALMVLHVCTYYNNMKMVSLNSIGINVITDTVYYARVCHCLIFKCFCSLRTRFTFHLPLKFDRRRQCLCEIYSKAWCNESDFYLTPRHINPKMIINWCGLAGVVLQPQLLYLTTAIRQK